jgi:hypothetical protein
VVIWKYPWLLVPGPDTSLSTPEKIFRLLLSISASESKNPMPEPDRFLPLYLTIGDYLLNFGGISGGFQLYAAGFPPPQAVVPGVVSIVNSLLSSGRPGITVGGDGSGSRLGWSSISTNRFCSRVMVQNLCITVIFVALSSSRNATTDLPDLSQVWGGH